MHGMGSVKVGVKASARWCWHSCLCLPVEVRCINGLPGEGEETARAAPGWPLELPVIAVNEKQLQTCATSIMDTATLLDILHWVTVMCYCR